MRMLEISAGARKKGKHRMRLLEVIKRVTELSVNDIKLLVQNWKSDQRSQKEETDQCVTKEMTTTNQIFQNAAYYIQKDRQES